MVSFNGYPGIYESAFYNRISILLRGFYDSYSIGKNAAGDDFPDDDSGSSSIYGGRSIWGQIDMIINRYHWPFDYVLWGVSWGNLRLMLSDALRVNCKTKGVSEDPKQIIDINSSQGIGELKKLFG